MKWFLDFGTHFIRKDDVQNVGCAPNGLLSFYENGTIGIEHNVITWEASPRIYASNVPEFDNMRKKFATFQAINAAVLNYDGTVLFADLASNPSGSNCVGAIFKDQESARPELRHLDAVVEVRAQSITSIISDVLSQDPDAEISMKIDIEGGEFAVLSSLARTPSLARRIDEIYVEFHARFWRRTPLYLWRLGQQACLVMLMRLYGVRVLKHW
jgi:FkbM family methyltransferase